LQVEIPPSLFFGMSYFVDSVNLKTNYTLLDPGKPVIMGFPGADLRLRAYIIQSGEGTGLQVLVPHLLYHYSMEELNTGDTVLLFTEEQQEPIGEFEIAERQTIPNTKKAYEGKIALDWFKDTEYNETISCSIFYTAAEMNWIKTGIAPIEMEERVILFVDEEDQSINFFSSWQGQGLWKAYFRQTEQEGAAVEVYQLIACKRPQRDEARLLSDFSAQIRYHLDTLDYLRWQQMQHKKKGQKREL